MEIPFSEQHIQTLMRECQEEAERAIAAGQVPIAALALDKQGQVVGRAHNTQISSCDPSAHAEVNVVRQLCQQWHTRDLTGVRLMSNAETCSMCASMAIKAGIRHFYYGAPAEASMNPWLPLGELSRYTRPSLIIYGPIDAQGCAEQIRRGRELLG